MITRRRLVSGAAGLIAVPTIYLLVRKSPEERLAEAVSNPNKRQDFLDYVVEKEFKDKEKLQCVERVVYDHSGSISIQLLKESTRNYVMDERRITSVTNGLLTHPDFKETPREHIEEEVRSLYNNPTYMEQDFKRILKKRIEEIQMFPAATIQSNTYDIGRGRKSTIAMYQPVFMQLPNLSQQSDLFLREIADYLAVARATLPSYSRTRSMIAHEITHAANHFHGIKLSLSTLINHHNITDLHDDVQIFADEIVSYDKQINEEEKFGKDKPGFALAITSLGLYLHSIRNTWLMNPANFVGLGNTIMNESYRILNGLRKNYWEVNEIIQRLKIPLP